MLLAAAGIGWEPDKNPRWVIALLAVVALLFLAWTLIRGRRFTRTEALAMTGLKVFTIGSLTWTTQLTIGAFANGTVLPLVGIYTTWFLHPVAGRIVLYLGTAWWSAAIIHHDDATLIPLALSLVVQTIVVTEVFARVRQRLERLAVTDPLTGVFNRRGLTDFLERELARAARHEQPLSLVALDLDGLREVNNSRGHRAGDQLLQAMAAHWSGAIRSNDAIGRIGGDEFVLVLPCTTGTAAAEVVERMSTTSPGAWSSGIATGKPGDTTITLLERADRRLYEAKTARRTV